MLSRQSLSAKRCVESLIQVIEQVAARAAARLPMALDEDSVALLLFWTILRWERTFVLTCLEELGIDMWALTRDLDAFINAHKARDALVRPDRAVTDPMSFVFCRELDDALLLWLSRAEKQAVAMGCNFVGAEHLLLAIIASAGPELTALLARHGLHQDRLAGAVSEALSHVPAINEETPAVRTPEGPLGAGWDTRPAVGVPRRFGMGILLLMVTMYAVLFAVSRLLAQGNPAVLVAVAVFFTGVGLGQMLLYCGRYPRAASVWVGACLFPVEVLGLIFVYHFLGDSSWVVGLLVLFLLSPILGAFLGYLAGGLTAGVFLLLEKYAKRAAPEEPPTDSDEEQVAEQK